MKTTAAVADENGAVRCHATTIKDAFLAERGDEAAICSEDLYSIVVAVTDKKVVSAIKGDGVWCVKFIQSRAHVAECAHQLSDAN